MHAALGLPLVHAFADQPKVARLGLRRSYRSIQHDAFFHRRLQEATHQVFDIDEPGTGNLHKHIGGIVGRDRDGQVGHGFLRQREGKRRHELEGRHQVTAVTARLAEQLDGIVERGKPEKRCRHLVRIWRKLHGHGRDDAQGAFGADEQLLQVDPAIVLPKRRQSVEDAAVRQDHFQTEDQLARHPVSQHVDAAGIGGDVAAYAAGALGAERQREEHALFGHRVLEFGQDAACLDHRRKVVGIDLAYPVHSFQAENDLVRIGVRRRPENETCITALRHDRKAKLAARPDRLRDLLGRAGPQHGHRIAGHIAMPIAAIGQHLVAFGENDVVSQRNAQLFPPLGNICGCVLGHVPLVPCAWPVGNNQGPTPDWHGNNSFQGDHIKLSDNLTS